METLLTTKTIKTFFFFKTNCVQLLSEKTTTAEWSSTQLKRFINGDRAI